MHKMLKRVTTVFKKPQDYGKNDADIGVSEMQDMLDYSSNSGILIVSLDCFYWAHMRTGRGQYLAIRILYQNTYFILFIAI
jgi:hypothetical protein